MASIALRTEQRRGRWWASKHALRESTNSFQHAARVLVRINGSFDIKSEGFQMCNALSVEPGSRIDTLEPLVIDRQVIKWVAKRYIPLRWIVS